MTKQEKTIIKKSGEVLSESDYRNLSEIAGEDIDKYSDYGLSRIYKRLVDAEVR